MQGLEERLQEMLRSVARQFGGSVPPSAPPISPQESSDFPQDAQGWHNPFSFSLPTPSQTAPSGYPINSTDPFNREMPPGFQSPLGPPDMEGAVPPNLQAMRPAQEIAPRQSAAGPPPELQAMGANNVPFTPKQAGMMQDVSGYGRVRGGYDPEARSINMKGLEGPQVADRSVVDTLPGRQEVMNFAARIGLDTSKPGIEREALPKLLAYREQHGKLQLGMAQTQQALTRANLLHERAKDDPSQARDSLAALREFKLARAQLDLAEEDLKNSPEGYFWQDELPERTAAKGKVAKAKRRLENVGSEETPGQSSAPPEALAYLKAHPETRAAFEAKYGPQ